MDKVFALFFPALLIYSIIFSSSVFAANECEITSPTGVVHVTQTPGTFEVYFKNTASPVSIMSQVRFVVPRVSIPDHEEEQAVFFTSCISDEGVPYYEDSGTCIINELELSYGETLHATIGYTPNIYNFPETVFDVFNHEVDGLSMEKCNFSIDVSGGIPLPYTSTPTPTSAPPPTSTTAPVTTPTSSTTTTMSNASAVCTAAKPGSAPLLISAVPGTNSVTLTWSKATNPVTKYLVAYGTTSDAMQYGNPDAGGPETTSYTVKSLSGGTTYYFRVKAINDCMPGDFSNTLSAASTGIQKNTTGPATGFAAKSEIPGQLFDIALKIERAILNKSSDLLARVQFTSFGKIPTLVNMIYRIEDAKGLEVYSEKAEVTVETEKLVTKEFKSLNLGSGKYTLILATTYGKNVKDEFKQAFEVKGTSVSVTVIRTILTHIIAGSIGGFIIYVFIKRKNKKKRKIS